MIKTMHLILFNDIYAEV